MKGLAKIPSEQDLEAAYAVFQSHKKSAETGSLSLWSQWARFDPRLAEQWVGHVAEHWKEIPPALLNEGALEQPWPAAIGVLLEFVALIAGTRDRSFQHWMECVLSRVEPARHELFFIGTRAFAGQAMREDARIALSPYRKWGYLAREVLIPKSGDWKERSQITLVSPEVRRSALEQLILENPRISVQQYRDALGGWVGLRQAERDLKHFPGVIAVGRTRGRRYRKK